MRDIRILSRDIRVGDLVGGRRVLALERTPKGVLVARAGARARDLFADGALVDISRPDRVATQVLVQASATL